jgi:polyisoprenoid-binding protein YceI
MKKQNLFVLSAITLFLSACSTTVITDEERELPKTTETPLQSQSFNVDYAQSFIAFVGSKGDIVSHEGKFKDFDLEIKTDPSDPKNAELAKAIVTIEIPSMVTDSDGLTTHLLSPDFFDAETFPKATFITTSVTKTGDDTYQVVADLTIKEITKQVSFPIRMNAQFLTFTYDLDRTQFEIGPPAGGLKGIDANVPLEAKIVFL